MPNGWFKRKQHLRRLASGKRILVRPCWIPCGTISSDKVRRQTRSCPQCGAIISTVRMPNRGLVHFETGKALFRVKHACLHRGEGLSRKRDEYTLDLFAENEMEPQQNLE